MAALAASSRLPTTDPAGLASTYSYAYQFDATLFGPFLREHRRTARRRADRGQGRRRRAGRRKRRRHGDRARKRRADRRRPVRRLLGLRSLLHRQDAGRAVGGLVAMAAVRPRRGNAVPNTDRRSRPTPAPSRCTPAGAGGSRCSTASATAMSTPRVHVRRRGARSARRRGRGRADRRAARAASSRPGGASELGQELRRRRALPAASSSRSNRPASTHPDGDHHLIELFPMSGQIDPLRPRRVQPPDRHGI